MNARSSNGCAAKSAAFDFHDERSQHLDKAAHGYVYSMSVTNPGLIFDAYLDHRGALREALSRH